ncbi:MAG: dihydroorotate dehydrogenase electron transfer subunit [Spirochaetales bacterium]|nr:dihydroorotate dehydrogenase electron transfer subunit [Spirochaetales bacterium]
MKQIQAKVTGNNQIAKDYYKLVFSWEPPPDTGPGDSYPDFPNPQPGQFITIRVSETTVPLLRRPFAFSGYNAETGEASIIYLKRGKGTEILAGKCPGEYIDIIGPLGNYLKKPENKQKPVLVAGGIGLGPLLYFSSMLDQWQIPHLFIFGARTARYVPDMNSLKNVAICTDDGSKGFAGTVADFLNNFEEKELEHTMLYCCGPLPMLKACHGFATEYDLECYVVMEQIMACGVGACMGCTIKLKKPQGYARVCTEGPVFKSRDIAWT